MKVIQLFVFILCLVTSIWSLVALVEIDKAVFQEYNDTRRYRASHIQKIAEQMSYGFLALTVALFASVAYLLRTMSEGRKRWR